MKKVLAGILVLFIAGVCFLNILGDGQSGQKEQRYIVLGDGRAGELTAFARDEDNIEFITKSGADIEWLDGEALPELIESDREFSCVVVMTGISDMQNAEEYVAVLNKWGMRLKDERGADAAAEHDVFQQHRSAVVHGGTRRLGMTFADTPFVLCMTQLIQVCLKPRSFSRASVLTARS